MSNEEQAQRESARDAAPDGPGLQEDPAVVDPDDVVLDDGDVSPDTLEPELSVSPDALDLAEPALEPARISTDTAEAASLGEAAAEARAVAAEAERTGTLVGGPMPAATPAVRASPDGTEPAGGVAGARDTRDGSTAVGRPTGGGDGGGDDVGGPVGGPHAFPPEVGEPGLGDPGLHPGTDPAFIGTGNGARDGAGPAGRSGVGSGGGTPPGSPVVGPENGGATAARTDRVSGASGTPGGEPAEGLPLRDRNRPKGSAVPLLLVIGGVVVLVGLLIWLLVSLLGGTDDEERVDPSSLAAGECLAGFTDITEDAARVDCSEPHNAQLVASENYPEDAAFPGRDQLGLRAESACATASSGIDPDAIGGDVQVTLLRATPTTETWAGGDRRVDCFAVVEDGGTLSRSLLGP